MVGVARCERACSLSRVIPGGFREWHVREQRWNQRELVHHQARNRHIGSRNGAALGSGQRSIVFVLRDIEGLSLEETAEALGLSLSAVKARSWRARLQLRERLSEYFNTPEEFAGVEPRSSGAELADLERCQTVRGTLGVIGMEPLPPETAGRLLSGREQRTDPNERTRMS